MKRTGFTFVFAALGLAVGLTVAGCDSQKPADTTPEGKAQYQAPMESMKNTYGANGQRVAPGGGGGAPAPAAGQPAPPGPAGATKP